MGESVFRNKEEINLLSDAFEKVKGDAELRYEEVREDIGFIRGSYILSPSLGFPAALRFRAYQNQDGNLRSLYLRVDTNHNGYLSNREELNFDLQEICLTNTRLESLIREVLPITKSFNDNYVLLNENSDSTPHELIDMK